MIFCRNLCRCILKTFINLFGETALSTSKLIEIIELNNKVLKWLRYYTLESFLNNLLFSLYVNENSDYYKSVYSLCRHIVEGYDHYV